MTETPSAPAATLPQRIFSGWWPYGHCQGIALDPARRCIFWSFTTALVKTDLDGRLLGTVTGLLGHLGCIACGPDGRIYGSLEYKADAIGQAILQRAGSDAAPQTGFYVAIFESERIDRPGLDACADGVMTAVWLREVVQDYAAVTPQGPHRYGCSGIDGLTFGPVPGTDGPARLFVAYGVYGDTARTDNDHQILLSYDPAELLQYARPLAQTAMHRSGPPAPRQKFFVHTGNTTYGVQNLEYDPFTRSFFMAVYRGHKPQYPNYDLYAVDGRVPPRTAALAGAGERGRESVPLLTLRDDGSSQATPGWYYPYGSTGLCALGGGLYYLSRPAQADERFAAEAVLCRWDGTTPFVPVRTEREEKP